MIRNEWLDNAAALIRQNYPPAMELLKAHQAGGYIQELLDNDEMINAFKGYGTRLEAVIKHIVDNYRVAEIKPKSKRKKKAVKADSEVNNNGD